MTRIIGKDGAVESLNSAASRTPPKPVVTVEPAVPTETPQSPAESREERTARLREERARVSMSVPQMKMKVPEIPGYHMHWFNDAQGRIQRALRSGYEFVDPEEVDRHDFSLAGDSTKPGNSDLGSRVSMVVGTNEAGQAMVAYLMKIKEELWRIDQDLLQERNNQISAALKQGRIGMEGVDAQDLKQMYTGSKSIPSRVVEISRRDIRLIQPRSPVDPSTDI